MTDKQIPGSTAPDGSRYITLTDGEGSLVSLVGGSVIVDSTVITGGTNGRVLYNNSNTLGEKAVTGSGNVVLATSPTVTTPTLGTDRGILFTNQTSAAAAQTGTLTNAPASGNPGFWLKIKINGVDYTIPAWAG